MVSTLCEEFHSLVIFFFFFIIIGRLNIFLATHDLGHLGGLFLASYKIRSLFLVDLVDKISCIAYDGKNVCNFLLFLPDDGIVSYWSGLHRLCLI